MKRNNAALERLSLFFDIKRIHGKYNANRDGRVRGIEGWPVKPPDVKVKKVHHKTEAHPVNEIPGCPARDERQRDGCQ